MKYKCTSKIPVLVVLEGKLTKVVEGEIIDVPSPIKGPFSLLPPTTSKKAAPVAKSSTRKTPKVTNDGDSTETSIVR